MNKQKLERIVKVGSVGSIVGVGMYEVLRFDYELGSKLGEILEPHLGQFGNQMITYGLPLVAGVAMIPLCVQALQIYNRFQKDQDTLKKYNEIISEVETICGRHEEKEKTESND